MVVGGLGVTIDPATFPGYQEGAPFVIGINGTYTYISLTQGGTVAAILYLIFRIIES